MFIRAFLECGVEVLMNPSLIASATINKDGVHIEFSTGRTVCFPMHEADSIRKGLESYENAEAKVY
jgi:hypothetical protein